MGESFNVFFSFQFILIFSLIQCWYTRIELKAIVLLIENSLQTDTTTTANIEGLYAEGGGVPITLSFCSLLYGTPAAPSVERQHPEAWPASTYGHLRGYMWRNPYLQVLYLHLTSSLNYFILLTEGKNVKCPISNLNVTIQSKWLNLNIK